MHRWATIAVKLAADSTCFPDQLEGSCQIHQVDKLYYNVLPQQSVEKMPEHDMPAAVMMDGVPFPFVGYTDQEITTIVDVTEYVEQKLAGIRCHRTQVGEDSPYLKEPEEAKRDPWFRQETFILARSSVGQPKKTEADLFAGLR